MLTFPRSWLRLIASVGLLVACGPLACATTSESPPEPAPADEEADKAPVAAAETYTVTPGDLDAALAGPWRKDNEKARDDHRHPKASLAFFGVTPASTVIEVWPGGGWYTAVLAPYLKGEGKLITAGYPSDAPEPRGRFGRNFAERLDAHPEVYGDVERAYLLEDTGHMDLGDGVADVVITFRNTHNMVRFGSGPAAYFAAMAKAIKPGGVFGVIQHRAPEHHPEGESGQVGYLKASFVIRLAQDAGLVLEAESEINANAKDTADHDGGVWTLPPGLQKGDEDRDKYLAIGESDRMTLRFIKPASEGAAVTTYWVGTSQASSPDGKTPYGPPTVAMAMRTVRSDDGIITETVLDRGVLRTVMMQREEGSARFAVKEADSFGGHLDFAGHDTQLDGWSYAITMADGSGNLSGVASVAGESMSTDKVFADPGGTPRARIRETFAKVDRDAFWAKLKEATIAPPPPPEG